jgi:hypothetical protein
MGVDYGLLGRLEVMRDGVPVELGAYRQRALLGLLLANAGTVLSTDRILDELWGESSGTDKQGSLWVYVSGLRVRWSQLGRSAHRARVWCPAYGTGGCVLGAAGSSRNSTISGARAAASVTSARWPSW